MPIPKLVVTVALMAAQMALTASKRIKGPRLEDLSVSLADYGTPIPRFWGKRRLNPQTIWAEKLHERKKTSKTKGGKYTEYKYYGTWAVLICDHEIDDISRIWFDKRLVYDRTGAGPISIASLLDNSHIKLTSGGNMRIYLGTEDQLPDPRIEAWCEDRYGADTCPAYRGSAYIVFEEIPLEQVGNRIPQITVEAINSKTDIYPYEQHDTDMPEGSTFSISPSGNWLVHHGSVFFNTVNLEWWDVPSRTLVGESQVLIDFTMRDSIALANDGTAYFINATDDGVGGFNISLYTVPPLGQGSYVVGNSAHGTGLGPTRVLETTAGRKIYTPRDIVDYLESGFLQDSTDCLRDACVDADGVPWGLFQPDGASSAFSLVNLITQESHSFTAAARTDVNTARICYSEPYGTFMCTMSGNFYIVDKASWTLTDSGVAGWGSADVLPYNNPHATTFWNRLTQYSLQDGSQLKSISASSFLSENSADATIYDSVNDASWARPDLSNHLTIRFLNRIGSNGVTLATVVDDVSEWCGLTGQDTTDLTQTVLGYSVTQGSGKDMISPLLDIHDVDARPHDFSIQFLNRGDASGGTILTQDFARENGPRYEVAIQQDTDLPREITFNFADWDHDQQPNNVKSPRPVAATSSSRSEVIDLTTYADTADSAQQKADRFMRRTWNSRERTKLSLTAQYLALEPGDVRTLSLDGAQRNARLDKMTITPTQIDCEWVRDETAFAALNNASGPGMDGRDAEEIFIPSQSRGFVLDIPYVQDADNDINPTLYVAAGGIGDPWPGAFIYRGDDGTYDDQFAAIDTTAEATWGLTTDTLASTNPNVWDRGSSVNVKLFNGTLTTVTEAEIDADPSLNLAAIGNQTDGYEMVNFATATLEADGTYTLSGFKRARRGTAVAAHSSGDEFLLLDNALAEPLGTDDIGDALSFKAVSAGRSVDGSPAIDLTYAGASLKPYAPARLKTYYDGTDLQCTIFRRTRVGGSWSGGSTIPLSENSEEYEIDVYNGATLKRTITSATNTFTYTAAMAAADGTTLPTLPTFNVYQMSDAVGRGFALAA